MADFCKQCSTKIMGEDFRDLAGLLTDEEARKGMVRNVICEGCGNAWVDNEGECHSTSCLEHHGGVYGA